MIDYIVGAIVVVIVGLALAYIIRARKNGVKCVGCPDAKTCSACGHGGEMVSANGCGGRSCTGCGCHTDTK